MAVAKAQYAISEITTMLRSKGVNVRVSLGLDELSFNDLEMYLVCYPPCCWSYAWTVQRSSGRSLRAIR